MTRMTGGQALVKSLYQEGVRVVFGVPGVQMYDAMDALYQEPGIRFITTRHEQAAAYMAFGFSQAGGGVGTALVVPGPGLLNASAAVGTAHAASSPILVVSGQVRRDELGKNRGALHEVDDQLDAIRTVTKWASRVPNPADLPGAVHEAFRQLNTGRPRPVEIEVPWDTLSEEADVELVEPVVHKRPPADASSIRRAAEILASAKGPLVWAGGGVISSGGSDALRSVAEYLQVPVVTTREGKGAISDRHNLSLGVPGYSSGPLYEYVQGRDVILAVGTRLTRAKLGDGQKVVQINVDGDEIRRDGVDAVPLVGDARRTLEGLYQALSSSERPHPGRQPELDALKTAVSEHRGRLEPQGSYVRAVRSAMPDDGIIVEGVTQIGYAAGTLYPVYEPGTYITSSYFGNLGYAYPTALGAKVARPERAVVAISGDGGFLFNSQELATAVMYGINAVVIVFNDSAYGNVLRDQVEKFGGRIIGSELHNPDFVKLAEAYGATGIKAEGPEGLEAALRGALEAEEPTLIEVPVGPMSSPW